MRHLHTSGRRRAGGSERTAQLGTERLTERLAAIEQLVVEQQARIAEQQQELEQLRAAVGEAPTGPAGAAPTSTVTPEGQDLILPRTVRARQQERQMQARASRRALLKIGGAAAAAGVAASAFSLSSGQSAQAAGRAALRPSTVTNWTTSSFTADAETVVAPSSGSYSANDILQVKFGTLSPYSALTSLKAAIAGYDTTGNHIGLYGTSSAGYGLMGITNTGTGATGGGLNGTANSTGTGVVGMSNSGVGVSGSSTNGLGGTFSGGQAPIALGTGGPPGAPTGGNHIVGEIYADGNADLWVCVVPGTPGQWQRLAHVSPPVTENSTLTYLSGGAITYITKPIRLLDTRGSDALALHNGGGAITGASPYTLTVAGVNWQNVQVPFTAVGAIGNLTVVADTGASGYVAIVPSGAGFSGTANVAYTPGQIVSNSFNVGLNGSGALDIIVNGSTDVIIDLFGVVV